MIHCYITKLFLSEDNIVTRLHFISSHRSDEDSAYQNARQVFQPSIWKTAFVGRTSCVELVDCLLQIYDEGGSAGHLSRGRSTWGSSC